MRKGNPLLLALSRVTIFVLIAGLIADPVTAAGVRAAAAGELSVSSTFRPTNLHQELFNQEAFQTIVLWHRETFENFLELKNKASTAMRRKADMKRRGTEKAENLQLQWPLGVADESYDLEVNSDGTAAQHSFFPRLVWRGMFLRKSGEGSGGRDSKKEFETSKEVIPLPPAAQEWMIQGQKLLDSPGKLTKESYLKLRDWLSLAQADNKTRSVISKLTPQQLRSIGDQLRPHWNVRFEKTIGPWSTILFFIFCDNIYADGDAMGEAFRRAAYLNAGPLEEQLVGYWTVVTLLARHIQDLGTHGEFYDMNLHLDNEILIPASRAYIALLVTWEAQHPEPLNPRDAAFQRVMLHTLARITNPALFDYSFELQDWKGRYAEAGDLHSADVLTGPIPQTSLSELDKMLRTIPSVTDSSVLPDRVVDDLLARAVSRSELQWLDAGLNPPLQDVDFKFDLFQFDGPSEVFPVGIFRGLEIWPAALTYQQRQVRSNLSRYAAPRKFQIKVLRALRPGFDQRLSAGSATRSTSKWKPLLGGLVTLGTLTKIGFLLHNAGVSTGGSTLSHSATFLFPFAWITPVLTNPILWFSFIGVLTFGLVVWALHHWKSTVVVPPTVLDPSRSDHDEIITQRAAPEVRYFKTIKRAPVLADPQGLELLIQIQQQSPEGVTRKEIRRRNKGGEPKIVQRLMANKENLSADDLRSLIDILSRAGRSQRFLQKYHAQRFDGHFVVLPAPYNTHIDDGAQILAIYPSGDDRPTVDGKPATAKIRYVRIPGALAFLCFYVQGDRIVVSNVQSEGIAQLPAGLRSAYRDSWEPLLPLALADYARLRRIRHIVITDSATQLNRKTWVAGFGPIADLEDTALARSIYDEIPSKLGYGPMTTPPVTVEDMPIVTGWEKDLTIPPSAAEVDFAALFNKDSHISPAGETNAQQRESVNRADLSSPSLIANHIRPHVGDDSGHINQAILKADADLRAGRIDYELAAQHIAEAFWTSEEPESIENIDSAISIFTEAHDPRWDHILSLLLTHIDDPEHRTLLLMLRLTKPVGLVPQWKPRELTHDEREDAEKYAAALQREADPNRWAGWHARMLNKFSSPHWANWDSIKPGEVIMDYAVGTGGSAIPLLRYLKEKNIHIKLVCIDVLDAWPSKAYEELHREKLDRFHSIEFYSLRNPSPDGPRIRKLRDVIKPVSIDRIFSISTLHLIPPKVLSELVQDFNTVLKPGGRVVWASGDLIPVGEPARTGRITIENRIPTDRPSLLHDSIRMMRAWVLTALGQEPAEGAPGYDLFYHPGILPARKLIQGMPQEQYLDIQKQVDAIFLPVPHTGDGLSASFGDANFQRIAVENVEIIVDQMDWIRFCQVPSLAAYLGEIAKADREWVVRFILKGYVFPQIYRREETVGGTYPTTWVFGKFKKPGLQNEDMERGPGASADLGAAQRRMELLFHRVSDRAIKYQEMPMTIQRISRGALNLRTRHLRSPSDPSPIDIEIFGGLITRILPLVPDVWMKGLFWGVDERGNIVLFKGDVVRKISGSSSSTGEFIIQQPPKLIDWDLMTQEADLFELEMQGFDRQILYDKSLREKANPTKPMLLDRQLVGDPSELGRKGWAFRVLNRLHIHYPPGMMEVVSTSNRIRKQGRLKPADWQEIIPLVHILEQNSNTEFGNPERPIFFSVRSSPVNSMPDVLPTIVNVGMNDATARSLLALPQWSEKTVMLAYKKLIQTYSEAVFDISDDFFDELDDAYLKSHGVGDVDGLNGRQCRELVTIYRERLRSEGHEFPQDPVIQLQTAIASVAKSWDSEASRKYRSIYKIPPEQAEGVIIETMVFGHRNEDSGTGVIYSRDPDSGENRLAGAFKFKTQGIDLVSGKAHGSSVAYLETKQPDNYKRLANIMRFLERFLGRPVEVEITIDSGRLYVLQFREARLSPIAAPRVYQDMVDEGLISRFQFAGLMEQLAERLQLRKFYKVKPEVLRRLLGRGHYATAGGLRGTLAFTAEKAREIAASGGAVVLARNSLDTEALDLIFNLPNVALVTKNGDQGSHELVLTRAAGIPAVVGFSHFRIEPGRLFLGDHEIPEGTDLVVDADRNDIFTTDDVDVLISQNPVADASFGVDFKAEMGKALSPYLDPQGNLRPGVTYQTLFDANLRNYEEYQELDQLCKSDPSNGQLQKEAFLKNLQKHYLHDLLIQLGAKDGKRPEDIALALKSIIATGLSQKMLQTSLANSSVVFELKLSYDHLTQNQNEIDGAREKIRAIIQSAGDDLEARELILRVMPSIDDHWDGKTEGPVEHYFLVLRKNARTSHKPPENYRFDLTDRAAKAVSDGQAVHQQLNAMATEIIAMAPSMGSLGLDGQPILPWATLMAYAVKIWFSRGYHLFMPLRAWELFEEIHIALVQKTLVHEAVESLVAGLVHNNRLDKTQAHALAQWADDFGQPEWLRDGHDQSTEGARIYQELLHDTDPSIHAIALKIEDLISDAAKHRLPLDQIVLPEGEVEGEIAVEFLTLIAGLIIPSPQNKNNLMRNLHWAA